MPRKKNWWKRLSKEAKQRSRYAARRFDLLMLDRRHSDLRWMHDQLGVIEAELIALAQGSWERLEFRRRAAEILLNTCLLQNAPWTVSRAALSSLESLGYTNTDRRVHFAIILGRYAPPDCPSSIVVARLREAIRRTKFLPRRSPFRRAYVPMMEELISMWTKPRNDQERAVSVRNDVHHNKALHRIRKKSVPRRGLSLNE